jgi:hypothetical protein
MDRPCKEVEKEVAAMIDCIDDMIRLLHTYTREIVGNNPVAREWIVKAYADFMAQYERYSRVECFYPILPHLLEAITVCRALSNVN